MPAWQSYVSLPIRASPVRQQNNMLYSMFHGGVKWDFRALSVAAGKELWFFRAKGASWV
jgi:hypothetical protein